VVGGSVVVDFVNRDSGVHNVGLDNLLLDDRLDGLVDVVVDMFTTDSGRYTLALGSSVYTPLVPELSLLLNKIPLCGVMVAVIKLTVLYSTKFGLVLLWKNLAVHDGLDRTVVVILVDLLVNSSVDLLMYVRLDGLVGDGGSNSLVDRRVVMARTLGEVGESCLDFVHFDV